MLIFRNIHSYVDLLVSQCLHVILMKNENILNIFFFIFYILYSLVIKLIVLLKKTKKSSLVYHLICNDFYSVKRVSSFK